MEIVFGVLGVIAGAALVALGWAWQREHRRRIQAESALTANGFTGVQANQANLAARNRELALLNHVITASTLDSDLRAIMTAICRELALIIDVPITSILLATPDGTLYEMVAEYTADVHRRVVGMRVPAEDSPYVRFLQLHKQTLAIPDVLNVSWIELNEASRALMQKRGTRSLILVPLLDRDQVIGLIDVEAPQPRVFSEPEIALVERVGAALSQALHISRLNADLRDSQERLRAAFDTAAVGLCITDAQDRYRQVNARWARMMGQNMEAMIGQVHGATVYSEDRATYQAALAQLADGHETTSLLELRFCPPNGQVFWGSLSLACISDAHGTVGSVVHVIQDVSARRQAEEEREQLIRDLDAFAHSVAHNLKNPLAVVMGYTTMLAEDLKDVQMPGDVSLSKILQSMDLSARHMDEIITTMLFFARVRSTRDLTLYPVNIKQTIMSALQRLDFMIAEYHAEIVQPSENSPEAWPAAWGYSSWIIEVWVNYISNALKYGGDHPRIELGWNTLPDGMLRFWVRDHGGGIAPQDMERLFKPFERLQATRSGHGLGLSIVQRLVEKLNGQVGVESAEGEGSLFYFTLPPNPHVLLAAQMPNLFPSGHTTHDTPVSS